MIPGSGRSPEGRHGNALQYSCLENPMDRGTWRATVHVIAKSQTRLKRLSMHACTHLVLCLKFRVWVLLVVPGVGGQIDTFLALMEFLDF